MEGMVMERRKRIKMKRGNRERIKEGIMTGM